MDGLDMLKQDHDRVRELFGEFRKASEADDTDKMRAICEKVFTELEIHTAIEEEHLYPTTEELGEALDEMTDESLEEHHVVDLLVKEIRKLDPSDDQYKAKMTVLMENVEHHAEEEEKEMFPKVRDKLSRERLDELTEQLREAKEARLAKANR